MDYEKKYKEALERAKHYQKENDFALISEIFPELKESEEERVKRLIFSITNKMGGHLRDIFTEEEYQCFDAWSYAWLEKQRKQNALWHSANEEPEEMREIFCEWESQDATWHDIVFYHADTKAFVCIGRKVEGIVKWAYVKELLEMSREG